jgi:hypothetical protein
MYDNIIATLPFAYSPTTVFSLATSNNLKLVIACCKKLKRSYLRIFRKKKPKIFLSIVKEACFEGLLAKLEPTYLIFSRFMLTISLKLKTV